MPEQTVVASISSFFASRRVSARDAGSAPKIFARPVLNPTYTYMLYVHLMTFSSSHNHQSIDRCSKSKKEHKRDGLD